MSIADNLHRRLDLLESALALKKSGVPSKIIALCYSEDPEDIAEAKDQMLARYGVKSEEVLEAAGSSIQVAAFPWAKGRGVGITSNEDPKIPEPIREQAMARFDGNVLGPVVGSTQHTHGYENPEVQE